MCTSVTGYSVRMPVNVISDHLVTEMFVCQIWAHAKREIKRLARLSAKKESSFDRITLSRLAPGLIFACTYFICLCLYSKRYPGKMVPYHPCTIFTYRIHFTWYFLIVALVYVQRMGVFVERFRNHLKIFHRVWKEVCVLSVKRCF